MDESDTIHPFLAYDFAEGKTALGIYKGFEKRERCFDVADILASVHEVEGGNTRERG